MQPRFWRDAEEALERNREVVRDSTIEDWLPTVTTYDADGEESGTAPLLDCATVTVPDTDDAALGTMAVLGFDVDDPADTDRLGVATDTRLAYFSPTRMYLATQRLVDLGLLLGRDAGPAGTADDGRSRIYAFELDGTDATYAASGVVDGVIADRWSMDEHDGVLRVAVGPSQETGNFNSVRAAARGRLRPRGGRPRRQARRRRGHQVGPLVRRRSRSSSPSGRSTRSTRST